jgi:hypothetical protein
MFAKGVSNLGDRTIAILGVALQNDRRASWSVTLVNDLLVVSAFDCSRASVDCSLNVLHRHGDFPGFIDDDPQSRVHSDIAPTRPRGNDNLTADLGELLAANRVLLPFANPNVLPFGMACHVGYFGTESEFSLIEQRMGKQNSTLT